MLAINHDSWDIFTKLSKGNISIDSIFKEYPFIEKFWKMEIFPENIILEQIDKVFLNANKKIAKILKSNIKNLYPRNIVMAKLGYYINNDYKKINIADNGGKEAVFISGTGNELFKLLEKGKEFEDYNFIIFDKIYENDKDYKSYLKRNLGYILTHQSKHIPLHLKKNQ